MHNVAPRKKFAFVVHYVEDWNWLLPIFKHLNDNPYLAVFWVWLVPVFVLMAYLYRIGPKAFEVIDSFEFAGISGDTLAVRNFGKHYMNKARWKSIKKRILETVLAAQERGATVIGLGALNKAEWLTDGGAWIVEELTKPNAERKLKVPLVHGDTLTAAVVSRQAADIIERLDLREKPVFLIGPTSKIGRAVALSLVRRGIRVMMYTNSRRRFEAILEEAGHYRTLLERTMDLRDGRNCRLWITGKAEPHGAELVNNLPYGAVVLNFSVPDPLSQSMRLLRNRLDIHHLDGGLMAYDPATTSMWNRIRLIPGLTYACHAGTIVHAAMGWTDHEIGPVEVDRMDVVLEAAFRVGFDMPPWTSFLRPCVLPTPKHHRASLALVP